MEDLPKLSVKREPTDFKVEIQDFEAARNFPYDEEVIIVAEGRQITSFDDLLNLARQEKNRNKEILEVIFLPMIIGG